MFTAALVAAEVAADHGPYKHSVV